jgi:hypothetical protein
MLSVGDAPSVRLGGIMIPAMATSQTIPVGSVQEMSDHQQTTDHVCEQFRLAHDAADDAIEAMRICANAVLEVGCGAAEQDIHSIAGFIAQFEQAKKWFAERY